NSRFVDGVEVHEGHNTHLSSCEAIWRGTVRNKLAGALVFVLIPIAALTASKGKENIEIKVVSSKTGVHNSFPNEVFSYTSVMFTQVDGKNVVYTCDQHGDICPPMEDGKTYMAERDGDVIYVTMSVPEDKHPLR